jgi:hypothetical protein
MLMIALPAAAAAQHAHADTAAAVGRTTVVRLGAHAVPLLTHVTPILNGAAYTEAYLTQPTLFGALRTAGGALRVAAAVSLEPLTLDRGELSAGAYGEGYVDRRHPHTYLHELMLSAQGSTAGIAASVAVGRGFAPFGSDDPMMRPFVKFPVNHHLGQVLERLVAMAGVRVGPVLLEAGVFNGDEPASPDDFGSFDRFGDSWSGRVTIMPAAGVELQASRAAVTSPELPMGGGWDQRKWSASGRYAGRVRGRPLQALAEWKRTTQVDRGRDVFAFGSVLLETQLDVQGWRPAVRLERSERPEEERTGDPFRSPWPHGGGHVLGITRWNIAGVRLERDVVAGTFGIAPFVELSFAHVQHSVQGLFSAREHYGSSDIRTLNLGARLRAGMHPERMGRYGVAAAPSGDHTH